VLAELARRAGTGPPRAKFHGELADGELAGERVLLLSPLTYMNRSGTSVREARDFFALADGDLLVICDDLNLPVGKIRLRAAGSSGGHKGLEDIAAKLQSEEFPRLRIGIGAPPEGWDAADFVLARFTSEQLPEIERAVSQAADAAMDWVRHGIAHCMNRYN
jgi:PTH1 family peptidyl-tRNA hydrolase